MSKILNAIQSAATDVVEHSSLFYKVRKVNSADLAKVGFAALAMAAATSDDADDQSPEDAARRVTPKQAEQLANLQDATVAAGVTAVSEDGETWEDMQLVIDIRREDPDNGILCVTSLPAGTVTACFTAIMTLSTDEGRAAERLHSFRSGTRPAVRDLDAGDQNGPLAARGAQS